MTPTEEILLKRIDELEKLNAKHVERYEWQLIHYDSLRTLYNQYYRETDPELRRLLIENHALKLKLKLNP